MRVEALFEDAKIARERFVARGLAAHFPDGVQDGGVIARAELPADLVERGAGQRLREMTCDLPGANDGRASGRRCEVGGRHAVEGGDLGNDAPDGQGAGKRRRS